MSEATRHQLLVAFYAAYEAQCWKRPSSPEYKAFILARNALREFDGVRSLNTGGSDNADN